MQKMKSFTGESYRTQATLSRMFLRADIDFFVLLDYPVNCARGATAEIVSNYRPSLPDPANTGVGKPEKTSVLTDVAEPPAGGSFFCFHGIFSRHRKPIKKKKRGKQPWKQA